MMCELLDKKLIAFRLQWIFLQLTLKPVRWDWSHENVFCSLSSHHNPWLFWFHNSRLWKNILWECFLFVLYQLLLFLSSQSSTAFTTLHNPWSTSRSRPHESSSVGHLYRPSSTWRFNFFLLEYFLLELHIHWHIVRLISLLTFFPRTRLSVQFGRITVRRIKHLYSTAVSVFAELQETLIFCAISNKIK